MKKIGFVGAGNMARALINGLLSSGDYRPAQLWASDTSREQLARIAAEFKVDSAPDNKTLVKQSRTVVLAVKPQIMDGVLEDLRPAVTTRQLFISIAAGFKLSRLQRLLGSKARVMRVMPNTPALVGRAMSVVVRGRRATVKDQQLCAAILGRVGAVVQLRREELLDAVTGLSGSGPAYVYLFAEALVRAGRAQGLTEKVAAKLAFETLAGGAEMLLRTGFKPAALRGMVTSPGGTTVAGLEVLRRAGFAGAVEDAVAAATRRSKELARYPKGS